MDNEPLTEQVKQQEDPILITQPIQITKTKKTITQEQKDKMAEGRRRKFQESQLNDLTTPIIKPPPQQQQPQQPQLKKVVYKKTPQEEPHPQEDNFINDFKKKTSQLYSLTYLAFPLSMIFIVYLISLSTQSTQKKTKSTTPLKNTTADFPRLVSTLDL